MFVDGIVFCFNILVGLEEFYSTKFLCGKPCIMLLISLYVIKSPVKDKSYKLAEDTKVW